MGLFQPQILHFRPKFSDKKFSDNFLTTRILRKGQLPQPLSYESTARDKSRTGYLHAQLSVNSGFSNAMPQAALPTKPVLIDSFTVLSRVMYCPTCRHPLKAVTPQLMACTAMLASKKVIN